MAVCHARRPAGRAQAARTVCALAVGLAAGCVSFTVPPAKLAARFAARGVEPLACSRTVGDRTLGWVSLGPPEAPCAVLVHGSPGSFDAWLEVALDPRLAGVHLVLPDRPGYGASDRGRVEPSLARQAALLAPAVAACRGPAVLVGHSLAGAIVARYAADRPSEVAGLVLVAPSLDPRRERLLWFQRLARSRLVQALLPTDLVTSEREILPLAAELEELLAAWPAVRAATTVVQGMNDALVDPGNADFAQEQLSHVPLWVERLPDQGHLIPWERPTLVVDAILRHLALSSAASDTAQTDALAGLDGAPSASLAPVDPSPCHLLSRLGDP
jgi:pimeloyl-ACP methyl ester carboxylesterase